jgi:hypothetical protein
LLDRGLTGRLTGAFDCGSWLCSSRFWGRRCDGSSGSGRGAAGRPWRPRRIPLPSCITSPARPAHSLPQVLRLSSQDVPTAYAYELEAATIVQPEQVVNAVEQMCSKVAAR